MKLLDRGGKEITINNYEKINAKIRFLKKLTLQNPKQNLKAKIESIIPADIFASLLIESEISSRRQIIRTFNNRDKIGTKDLEIAKIRDFIDAYSFALKPKEFSIANFFTLYSLVNQHSIKTEDQLLDGHMFRADTVFIGQHQIGKNAFEGFKASNIKLAFHDLCNYLKNSSDDLYLKAIVGHIYFELIHPYYDFNGRTGRFIPLWLFNNANCAQDMMYFAIAMGNYKQQYLAIFNHNINRNTYEVNLQRMVEKMLDLLILNQKQYLWIKKIENDYLDQSKKSFSPVQKDFIWLLMIKNEIANGNNSWFKLNNDDRQFIELKLKDALFSKDTKLLEKSNIISISNDRPRKYKLNNYQCFGIFH